MKYLRDKCHITREGVSMLAISKSAEEIGLRTLALKISLEDLTSKVPLPCIVHWNYSHFVVVYKITKKKVHVSDPQIGLVTYSHEEFNHSWKKNNDKGYVLALEPRPEFYQQKDVKTPGKLTDYFQYLWPYRRFLGQVMIGMIAGIALSLVFPMITQSVVDIGIATRDLTFIHVLLIASVVLTLSSSISNFIQGRVMLYVSDRVNISMVSDFIKKLLDLPYSFFERKMTSDVLSRIQDHNRVQSFLFDSLLGIAVASLSFLVYSIILAYYDTTLFIVFLVGTLLYCLWVYLFLARRRRLDYQYFDASVANQSEILQVHEGIAEIKANNLQQRKRWDWEKSRLDIYSLNIKLLNLNQLQDSGSIVIEKLKNIFLTFIAAKAVIDGEMTLGMMLSVQYIIGQMNGPVGKLLSFIQSSQDAKISLERINEVRYEEEEEKRFEGIKVPFPEKRSIVLKDVSFKYNQHLAPVLDKINIEIPYGQTTAIVGDSGSGKSTLLKLLLRFYPTTSGNITLGYTDFTGIDLHEWRDRCGAVLQDGKLLNSTILENITLQVDEVDHQRLNYAIEASNLTEFVNELPLKLYTYVGQGGTGMSGGQKQRILIARAIYKNPDYIFLDEATNALDANNERAISENLIKFTEGKTSVIIAHRLSTVMAADQIVVLEKGKVVELGSHGELLHQEGHYFNLVKNQMLAA